MALPVDPGEYTVLPDRVVLEICQGPYIRYASKGFRAGDLVEVLSSSREREDEYWLAVFPSGTLSLEEADRTLVVEGQSAGCALFLAQGAQQPFMPGRALAKLQQPFWWLCFSCCREWHFHPPCCPGAMSLIFPTTPRSFPRSSPLLRSPL